MIDVNPNHLETITRILAAHVPECEVRAFGSRVTWTAKDYSDLDLAVVGARALDPDALRRMKEAFENSNLPFRVDVLDWHAISAAFQKVIEKKYEVVQKGKKSLGMAAEELVGALPLGWEYTTLGEACARAGGDVQTGPFGSQLHAADYVSRGIPSIMPQNIGDNRVVRDGIAEITLEDAERLKRYRVRRGDIVYSRRGDVERRALIRDAEDGWLCGTGCLRVRFGDEHVNPTYASYYLGDPNVREWIVRHAHGATMPNLNTAILSALPFVLPPLPEQCAIAQILGTLDDKIELNRRMNETLEAMARALFKSWFVDFDPVRAKADGRNPGLPQPLADLFADRLEITDSYTAPAGWRVLRWGELVTLEYGKSLEDYAGEENLYPVYGTNGRIGSCAKPLCEHEGVIIGRKGAYRGVHWCSEPFFVIDTAFFVEAKSPIELRWAYYELIRRDINSMDSGSAIPSTSRADFYGLEVLAPPFEVQQAFVRLLSPCWARQEKNAAESRTIAALRDTLLPKLISGELRVKDARRLLFSAQPGTSMTP